MAEIYAEFITNLELNTPSVDERQHTQHQYEFVFSIINNNEDVSRIHIPLNRLPHFLLYSLRLDYFLAEITDILRRKNPNLEILFGNFFDAYEEFENRDP